MIHLYKAALLAGYVLAPGLVLATGNPFTSRRRTAGRAVAAVLVGWLWLIATTSVITLIDSRLASSAAEVQEIYEGDGAKNAAALLFGWLPSLLLVVLAWAAVRSWRAVAGKGQRERAP